MLSIEKIENGQTIILKLIGKLNSVTSAKFKEESLDAALACSELILDFEQLQYVASAGLRVVLELHKLMTADNKALKLKNVDAGTMEILEATGLTRFLVIE